LPTDSFHFCGFLPAKAGQRRRALEKIADSEETEIFYEAPHRLHETLADAAEVLGPEREIVIARQLTKLHEEFIRGPVARIIEELKKREIRGEIVLLIGKAKPRSEDAQPKRQNPRARLEQIMAEQKLDEKAALKILAKEMGVSKSEAYRELQRSKPEKS
jgi:16S rRNA (cytidine1402-2'-O)-methyltransferase